MLLWLLLAARALLVAGLLVWTLLRRQAAPGQRSDYELEVCRAQLREVEREAERGILTAAEVEAARIEIQRRMLAADQARGETAAAEASTLDRVLPAVLAGLLPLAAFGLYAALGTPDRIDRPPAGATAQTEGGQTADQVDDIQAMLTRLQERLAEQPDDLDGWLTLGQTQMALGRYPQAVAAFERAAELRGDLPFVNASLGEALVFAASSRVTEEAQARFRKVLESDPQELRSRFYLAIAAEQAGDLRQALEGLSGLLADAPPDAAWAEAVRNRAVSLAEQLGEDPAEVLPAAVAAAPEAPAGAAAPVTQAEADRLAAQLEANPKDYEGWIELARTRFALGDAAGAQAALDSGAEAYPGAPFVQQQFQQVAAELGLGGAAAAPAPSGGGTRGPTAEDIAAAQDMSAGDQQEMIRGMVAGLAERLQSEPDDIEGWRMLARSYGVLNEPEKAVEAHRKVVTLLPNDATAQLGLAEALIAATASPDTPPPAEAESVLQKVLELDEKNPDALYHLGEVARRKGDRAEAARYWEKLLAELSPGSEEHDWLQQRLETLPKGE